MKKSRYVAALAALAILVLAACSKGTTEGGGSPAEGDGGVRTVEITALDELRFDPARVDVQAGKPVRFAVTNVGAAPHEFVLGDEATQMEHEGEMGTGGSMEHGGMGLPAITLGPGETKEVTVTFDEPGRVLYGCHVPGHYGAGMVGTVRVS